MTESSNEDLPVPARIEERVLVSRELTAGKETGQDDESMTFSSDSDPGEAPYLPRAVILERRDRISSCHPLLCGKEGAEVCYLEAFADLKRAQDPMFKDQSTYAGEDPGREPNLGKDVRNGDTEPREKDEESPGGRII